MVGYTPWGLKESDTTEGLHFHFSQCKKTLDIIIINTVSFLRKLELPYSAVNWNIFTDLLLFRDGKIMYTLIAMD